MKERETSLSLYVTEFIYRNELNNITLSLYNHYVFSSPPKLNRAPLDTDMK